jgi:hypothetical protein
MADRLLFIGWGDVVRGREDRASAVFDEVVGFYGRCQQEGRIERFEIAFLDNHASTLTGYFALHGTTQQIADLRDDEEFMRHMVDASLVVEDLRVVSGYTNEGVARQMDMWRAAIGKVPQLT